MKKKLIVLITSIVVSFNLIYVQPAKAWFFLPALANPAAMAFLGNAVVGGAALVMGIANIDDTKEHLTNLYNESRPLVESLGAKAKFAFDQATDKYIPMFFEGAKEEIANLYSTVRDSIINIYDSTLAKKNADVADSLSPVISHTVTGFPKQTLKAPSGFLFKVESKNYKGKFILSDIFYVSEVATGYVEFGNTIVFSNGLTSTDFTRINKIDNARDLVSNAKSFAAMITLAKLLDPNYVISLVSDDYLTMYNQLLSTSLDNYFPSIDADTPFYLPIPRAKTIEKVNDIPAGTDLIFNPVSQAWETEQGKVWQGTDAQLDVAIPQLKVLTNADGTVITDANGIPRTVATTDGATWIDTKTGETVTTGTGEGTTPIDDDITKVNWDKLKEIPITFTEKFPFSLPWDILYTAKELNVKPEKFKIQENFKVGTINIPIDIELPDWIDKYTPFIRSGFVIVFIIGLIYATRSLMGGGV